MRYSNFTNLLKPNFIHKPVKSNLKFENNELVLHTYGMAYGSTTRYFSFNEEGNSEHSYQTIKKTVLRNRKF